MGQKKSKKNESSASGLTIADAANLSNQLNTRNGSRSFGTPCTTFPSPLPVTKPPTIPPGPFPDTNNKLHPCPPIPCSSVEVTTTTTGTTTTASPTCAPTPFPTPAPTAPIPPAIKPKKKAKTPVIKVPCQEPFMPMYPKYKPPTLPPGTISNNASTTDNGTIRRVALNLKSIPPTDPQQVAMQRQEPCDSPSVSKLPNLIGPIPTVSWMFPAGYKKLPCTNPPATLSPCTLKPVNPCSPEEKAKKEALKAVKPCPPGQVPSKTNKIVAPCPAGQIRLAMDPGGYGVQPRVAEEVSRAEEINFIALGITLMAMLRYM